MPFFHFVIFLFCHGVLLWLYLPFERLLSISFKYRLQICSVGFYCSCHCAIPLLFVSLHLYQSD